MAPRATKKRKTAPEKFLCFSCDVERTSKAFPDFNPSVECEHLIHTCKACLKRWVDVCVEGESYVREFKEEKEGEGKDKVVDEEKDKEETADEDAALDALGLVFGVRCPHPECKGVMKGVNVEAATTKKVHKRFEEIERRFIAESTPNWRWCLNPVCSTGQVHVPLTQRGEGDPATTGQTTPPAPTKRKKGRGKKKAAIEVYEDPDTADPPPADICTCTACGFETCVPCDRPYHTGETCAAYQARTHDHMDEEESALKMVNESSKPCPGCKRRIQKNGGCPAVFCTQCHTHFCYKCVTVPIRGYCDCNRHLEAAANRAAHAEQPVQLAARMAAPPGRRPVLPVRAPATEAEGLAPRGFLRIRIGSRQEAPPENPERANPIASTRGRAQREPGGRAEAADAVIPQGDSQQVRNDQLARLLFDDSDEVLTEE